MYSSKKHLNILTALLAAHQVHTAVVCPGSRNAPIVHNLNEHPDISCYPVSDERSAGFYALGIALARREPVAVCVTSGTALLNLAPAVAEAYYQQVPLLVLSADRPQEWIGQLDGQTLPQGHALRDIVRKEVTLPADALTPADEWHCNRLVNEALLALHRPTKGPVHINVPIAEPLFDFTVPQLPDTRVVRHLFDRGELCADFVVRWWMEARRPLAVIGQYHSELALYDDETAEAALRVMSARGVVLSEGLTNLPTQSTRVDEALIAAGDDDEALQPDLVLYLGGHVVSKRLRQWLRRCHPERVVMVSTDGQLADVTTHLTDRVEVETDAVLEAFADYEEGGGHEALPHDTAFHGHWREVLNQAQRVVDNYEPPFSQMAVVRYFEEQLEDFFDDFDVYYANSSAIRQGTRYANHLLYCNRGVNGIDGTLSTAAGFSAVTDNIVFCVTGDLSFFYDQNALWNQNLRGNLRILLLNNGGGTIFRQLPGLEQSDAFERLVCATHATRARGIAEQCDIGYLLATNREQMERGIVTLMTSRRSRPMVLEVVTDPETDDMAVRQLQDLLKN